MAGRSLIVAVMFVLGLLTPIGAQADARRFSVSLERVSLDETNGLRLYRFEVSLKNRAPQAARNVRLRLVTELAQSSPRDHYFELIGPDGEALSADIQEVGLDMSAEPPTLIWEVEFEDESGTHGVETLP